VGVGREMSQRNHPGNPPPHPHTPDTLPTNRINAVNMFNEILLIHCTLTDYSSSGFRLCRPVTQLGMTHLHAFIAAVYHVT
jgi:hypothetical protein